MSFSDLTILPSSPSSFITKKAMHQDLKEKLERGEYWYFQSIKVESIISTLEVEEKAAFLYCCVIAFLFLGETRKVEDLLDQLIELSHQNKNSIVCELYETLAQIYRLSFEEKSSFWPSLLSQGSTKETLAKEFFERLETVQKRELKVSQRAELYDGLILVQTILQEKQAHFVEVIKESVNEFVEGTTKFQQEFRWLYLGLAYAFCGKKEEAFQAFLEQEEKASDLVKKNPTFLFYLYAFKYQSLSILFNEHNKTELEDHVLVTQKRVAREYSDLLLLDPKYAYLRNWYSLMRERDLLQVFSRKTSDITELLVRNSSTHFGKAKEEMPSESRLSCESLPVSSSSSPTSPTVSLLFREKKTEGITHSDATDTIELKQKTVTLLARIEDLYEKHKFFSVVAMLKKGHEFEGVDTTSKTLAHYYLICSRVELSALPEGSHKEAIASSLETLSTLYKSEIDPFYQAMSLLATMFYTFKEKHPLAFSLPLRGEQLHEELSVYTERIKLRIDLIKDKTSLRRLYPVYCFLGLQNQKMLPSVLKGLEVLLEGKSVKICPYFYLLKSCALLILGKEEEKHKEEGFALLERVEKVCMKKSEEKKRWRLFELYCFLLRFEATKDPKYLESLHSIAKELEEDSDYSFAKKYLSLEA